MVREMFEVRQSFALPDEEFEFQVTYDSLVKNKFVELKSKASALGYTPELSGSPEECVLVFRKRVPRTRSLPRMPVIFLFFTLAALVVSSIMEFEVGRQLVSPFANYVGFFAFGLSVAAVFAAHEVGQRIVARRRDAGHANSYMIPGLPIVPPFLPSIGFASSQHDPAVNRDSFFDAVMAGPMAMLLLSVLLYVIGDLTAVQSAVPFAQTNLTNTTVTIAPNAIQMGLDSLLAPFTRTVPAGYVLVSPVADAASIGFMLVFICLLPMAAYDGGLLASASWGPRTARAAGYLSVLALLAIDTPNYWAVAIVALLLVGRPFQLKLLDDVSALSPSRRWLMLALLVVALLCLPVPHNLASFPLG